MAEYDEDYQWSDTYSEEDMNSGGGLQPSASLIINEFRKEVTDAINLKVSRDNIISEINLAPGEIKIDADKITLVGAVTVLSDITGDLGTITAGRLEAVELVAATGTFSGKLTSAIVEIDHPEFASKLRFRDPTGARQEIKSYTNQIVIGGVYSNGTDYNLESVYFFADAILLKGDAVATEIYVQNYLENYYVVKSSPQVSGIMTFAGDVQINSGASTNPIRLNRNTADGLYIGSTYSQIFNNWLPDPDNSRTLGSSGLRWSQLYAGTATINTSDRRSKDYIEPIPEYVLDAWSEVNFSRFKFKDAIALKADEARWHVGLIAQEIEEVFQLHGLNAFDFGLLCYDEWDDMYDDNDVLVLPAGNRYSIRGEECLMLEAALVRRELNKLKGVTV